MNFPKIIALCGYKGSGKDAVANILVNNYGYTHLKFATKIKKICKILFDFTDADMEEQHLKKIPSNQWGISPRDSMIYVGTNIGQYEIPKFLNKDYKYIINDFNFQNATIEEKHKIHPYYIENKTFWAHSMFNNEVKKNLLNN